MSDQQDGIEEVRRRVRERGWDVVSVAARDGIPRYSYTVGLSRRGLSEFIVFGFSPDLARPALDDLAQRVRDGERFPNGVGLEDILPGMPAVLLDVPETEARHYLAAAREHAPRTLRALQIVWPDGADRFPWQHGYDDAFRARQVILNPFARTVVQR